jgi:hypothetical protein
MFKNDTMAAYVADRAPHLAGPRHRAPLAPLTVAALYRPRHRSTLAARVAAVRTMAATR